MALFHFNSFHLFFSSFHNHIYFGEQLEQQQWLAHFLPLYLDSSCLQYQKTPPRLTLCSTCHSSSALCLCDSIVNVHFVPINIIHYHKYR